MREDDRVDDCRLVRQIGLTAALPRAGPGTCPVEQEAQAVDLEQMARAGDGAIGAEEADDH